LRTAIFADIHANRPAFEACLKQAHERNADRIVLLGDYVGYGADPEWVTERVGNLVADGAIAIMGNHDSAVGKSDEDMNVEAQIAIEWTRGELGKAQRDFLATLPLTHRADDSLLVHADASAPHEWNYVIDASDAARSLRATTARLTLCGHVHRPAVYTVSAAGKMTAFTPVTDVPLELLEGRRWLVVAGSVGQPRDGSAAASYLLFDAERRQITFCRAPYDVAQAAAQIRRKGLPPWLADRLFLGR